MPRVERKVSMPALRTRRFLLCWTKRSPNPRSLTGNVMKTHELWSPNCFFVLVVLAGSAVGEDWAQWRGPNRDAVWNEVGITEVLPAGQLPLVWSYPVGPGYSGPTVAEGRVYVTDRIREPVSQERIHCVDALSGKRLWMTAYDCAYAGVSYEAGPRAAVSIEKGRAYSLGAMGDLYCLDAATGAVHWNRNLVKDYLVEMPIWGISASPLLYKDLVIIQAGGKEAGLIAVNQFSGQEVWKALPDKASYSAPILADFYGNKVVVVWTADSLSLVDPDSGKVHARHEFPPSRMPIGTATPVVHGNRIFVSSFYDGSLMVQVDESLSLQQVWRKVGPTEIKTEALHCMISTPIFDGDVIYGVDSYGELRCLDANTGERIWEDLSAVPKARWSCIHMVRQKDKTWMFNERGELLLGKLSPQGFQELGRSQLIAPTLEQLNMRGGVCWSHPAFANRHVFARNDEVLVSASLQAR